MKDLTELDVFRVPVPEGMNFPSAGPSGGVFSVPNPHSMYPLRVIATISQGWEHVSVSLQHRCPRWEEMEHVKRMFFNENEVVIQLHVAEKNHVNCHPFCLHLWRPMKGHIPTPPAFLVGPQ